MTYSQDIESVVDFIDQDYRYNQKLPKFFTMLDWHRSVQQEIEPGTDACETVTLMTSACLPNVSHVEIPKGRGQQSSS